LLNSTQDKLTEDTCHLLHARNYFRCSPANLFVLVNSNFLRAAPAITTLTAARPRLTAQQTQSRRPRPDTSPGGADYHLIHGFLVRKAEKAHGTGQRIEGFRKKGAKVVIVDDVCTTGSSTIQAIEAAREFGFDVVGVIALVEREEAKGRTNVEKAAAPARFVCIFTAEDIRAEHLRQQEEGARQ
jgi:hypothetical protein